MSASIAEQWRRLFSYCSRTWTNLSDAVDTLTESTDEDNSSLTKAAPATCTTADLRSVHGNVGLHQLACKLFLNGIERYLSEKIAPEFWKMMGDSIKDAGAMDIVGAIKFVASVFKTAQALPGVGDAAEHLCSPLQLHVVALSSANQPHDVEEEDEDGEPSTNGKRSTELTQEQWRDIFGIIGDFGTLETFDNCFADTLVEHIDAKVRETVAGKFEVPKLKSLETWLGTVAIPWLSMVLGRPIAEVKKEWLSKIEFYLFECFLQVRRNEMFDIIRSFPHTKPALEDLRRCLARTLMAKIVSSSLLDSFRKRLLVPGAVTLDIIEVYILTIKLCAYDTRIFPIPMANLQMQSLRLVDPTGVLLESVSEPIKAYLRGRPDTVRCIVSSLTGDSDSGSVRLKLDDYEPILQLHDISPPWNCRNERVPLGIKCLHELSKELASSDRRIMSDGESDDDNSDDDGEWEPDPVAADPTKTSRSRRTNDIISILVNIYGSQEIFVDEYRKMLSDKLLDKSDFNVDRETGLLERLKLRFGEARLQTCTIMLKDIEDSRRVNREINATATFESEGPVQVEAFSSTIVSQHFWPALNNKDLKMHETVERQMSQFAKQYNVLKNPRLLEWQNALGSVEIELEFDDGKARVFNVSPLQATIICNFGDEDSWTLEDLASKVGIEESVLRGSDWDGGQTSKLQYWSNQRVLERFTDTDGAIKYRVVRTAAATPDVYDDGEDDEPTMSSKQSAQEAMRKEMEVYVAYIHGMLRQFHSMPADKIYNMLKLYSGCDKTLNQMTAFLNSLVASNELECNSGVYSMVKAPDEDD